MTCVTGDSIWAAEHGLTVLYHARFVGSLDEFLKKSAELNARARAVYGLGISI